ncbi:hypothetical protein LSAT2_003680 [Lamellibrachia satsuma]|nr:hypothetical protein LSAT2_003680 [Lamellibrachia satsuma]
MTTAKDDGFKNYVHQELIWKDYVAKEKVTASKVWPENYGFLIDEYRQMTMDLTHGHVVQDRLGQLNQAIAQKNPVPKTTAGEIGWVSGDPERQLEIYGRYPWNGRGKRDITKSLGWPELGID